jgi:hypothetical protein
MWKKRKPESTAVSPSKQATSAAPADSEDPQLSESNRVEEDVASIALNRGLLAMGGHAPAIAGSAGELTDADVMLRVKAGDDSACGSIVRAQVTSQAQSSQPGSIELQRIWA